MNKWTLKDDKNLLKQFLPKFTFYWFEGFVEQFANKCSDHFLIKSMVSVPTFKVLRKYFKCSVVKDSIIDS